MLIIEANKVYLTRGDDAVIEIEISVGSEPYTLETGDSLTLTVREQPDSALPVLMSVSSNTNQIVINHEDTANIPPGDYSADVELRLSDGRRTTVWPTLDKHRTRVRNWANFMIMPEVTA